MNKIKKETKKTFFNLRMNQKEKEILFSIAKGRKKSAAHILRELIIREASRA